MFVNDLELNENLTDIEPYLFMNRYFDNTNGLSVSESCHQCTQDIQHSECLTPEINDFSRTCNGTTGNPNATCFTTVNEGELIKTNSAKSVYETSSFDSGICCSWML